MRSSDNIVLIRQTQFSAKSPPRKTKNKEVRPREYLTAHEVDELIKKAKEGRYGHRDATLILVMYRLDSVPARLSRSIGMMSSSKLA